MKKWLDDLYAILLKRGLITLDNSLSNYDSDKTTLDDLSYKISSDSIPINSDSLLSGTATISFKRIGELVELRFDNGNFDSVEHGTYNNVFTIPIEFRPRTIKRYVVTSRSGGKPVGLNIKPSGQIDIYVMSVFTTSWYLYDSYNTIMYLI